MDSIPERSFDKETEGGPQVISERTRKRQEDLDRSREARRRVLDDPTVRRRTKEIRDAIARGETSKEPGITAEELPDFLREHNS